MQRRWQSCLVAVSAFACVSWRGFVSAKAAEVDVACASGMLERHGCFLGAEDGGEAAQQLNLCGPLAVVAAASFGYLARPPKGGPANLLVARSTPPVGALQARATKGPDREPGQGRC